MRENEKAREVIKFKLDSPTTRALDATARKEGRTRPNLLRFIVRQYIDEQAKKMAPWDMSPVRRGRPRKLVEKVIAGEEPKP